MRSALDTAVRGFPLLRWLADHGSPVDSEGSYVRIDCPHCGGHATLSVHKGFKNCQCFRCSEGGAGGDRWEGKGSLVALVALVEQCSKKEAVSKIYAMAGMPDIEYVDGVEEEVSHEIPPEAIPLEKAHYANPCRQRLHTRGVGHLEPYISVCVTGRYASRWIIPAVQFGEQVGWEAKSYGNAKPKSLFPSWFKTSKFLYTTRNWSYTDDFVILTESIFDAETLGCNAIGMFGSVLRESQLGLLLKMRKERGIKRLVWFLDEDAWKKQTNAILRKTRTLFENSVVSIPKGSDPNSLGLDRCWQAVREATPVRDSFDIIGIALQGSP